MRKIISAAAALALCVNIGAGPILAAMDPGNINPSTNTNANARPNTNTNTNTRPNTNANVRPNTNTNPDPTPARNPNVDRGTEASTSTSAGNISTDDKDGIDTTFITVVLEKASGNGDKKFPGGIVEFPGGIVEFPGGIVKFPGGFWNDTDKPVEITKNPEGVTITNDTVTIGPKPIQPVEVTVDPETYDPETYDPGTNDHETDLPGLPEPEKHTNLTRDLPGMKGLQLSPDGGEQTGEEPGTLQLNIFQTGEESVLQLPDGELYPIDADGPVKLSGLFDSVAVEGGFPIGIGKDARIGYLSGQGANLQIQGTVENAEFGKKTTVRLLDGANVQNAILKYCKLTAQKGSTLGNMFGQSENAILNVQDGANLGSATMSKPGFVTGVPLSKLVGDTVKEATESKDSGGSQGGSSGGGGGGGNSNSGSGGNNSGNGGNGGNNNGNNPPPTPIPPSPPQPTGAEKALTDLFAKINGQNSTPGVKLGKGSVTGTEAIANGTLTISFESGWADYYEFSGSDGIQIAGTEPFTYTGDAHKEYANFVLNVDGKDVNISILKRTSKTAGTLSQLWEILSGPGTEKTIDVTGSDNKQYTVTFKPDGDGSSVTVNVSATPA